MKRQNADFNGEVTDPGFAAMLVTLGFPMGAAPRVTAKVDLGSGGQSGGESVAWRFGRVSATRELSFEGVTQVWGMPHGQDEVGVVPHVVRLCKVALHNYRCLVTAAKGHGCLYQARYGMGWRLSNWPMVGYEAVAEVQPGEVPIGAEGGENTAEIAAGVTLGQPLESFCRALGRVRWVYGVAGEGAVYTAAEVKARAGDTDYLQRYDDPLAVVLALFWNRKKLLEGIAGAEGKTMVLAKRGRYAVLSSAADRRTQAAVLSHLNV